MSRLPASSPQPPARGTRVLLGTVWNLLGLVTPLVAAFFCIPILLPALGPERFALLTLIWLLVGYLGLFDLGLSRALTNRVAERMAAADHDGMAASAWTGVAIVVAVTVPVALLLERATPFLVGGLLSVPPAIAEDARATFVVVAHSLPLVALTSALRGILEGLQRFGLANAIRTPLGVLTFLVPVLVWPIAPRLEAVAWALLAVRAAIAVALLVACLVACPALRQVRFSRRAVGPLMTFGAAMTVSNVVGPLMVYADRFAIGSLLSLTAVTYYSTPFEMVTRVLVLPTAVGTVLFPMFSTGDALSAEQSMALYERATRLLLLLLIPVFLIAAALAPEILAWWLGAEFASQAATVLQWLAAGCLFNGAAHLPYALLQGRGGAPIVAGIHLAELPLYVLMLWAGIHWRGIEGAAMAWTVRCAADWLLLSWQAARVVTGRGGLSGGGLVAVGTFLVLGVLAIAGPAGRVAWLVAGLAGLVIATLASDVLLDASDRAALGRLARGVRA